MGWVNAIDADSGYLGAGPERRHYLLCVRVCVCACVCVCVCVCVCACVRVCALCEQKQTLFI